MASKKKILKPKFKIGDKIMNFAYQIGEVKFYNKQWDVYKVDWEYYSSSLDVNSINQMRQIYVDYHKENNHKGKA